MYLSLEKGISQKYLLAFFISCAQLGFAPNWISARPLYRWHSKGLQYEKCDDLDDENPIIWNFKSYGLGFPVDTLTEIDENMTFPYELVEPRDSARRAPWSGEKKKSALHQYLILSRIED